jgi:hypothetical protein
MVSLDSGNTVAKGQGNPLSLGSDANVSTEGTCTISTSIFLALNRDIHQRIFTEHRCGIEISC